MENVGKHAEPAGSTPTCSQEISDPPSRPGQSVFHTHLSPAQQKMAECMLGTSQYLDLLHAVCGAGTHLGNKYLSLLRNTSYAGIAGQFHATLIEVERHIQEQRDSAQGVLDTQWAATLKAGTGSEVEGKRETEPTNPSENNQDDQMIAASFLQLVETQCRFFLSTSEALKQFSDIHSMEELQNSQLNVNQTASSVPAESLAGPASQCPISQSNTASEAAADQTEGSCKTGSSDSKPAGSQAQSVESPSRLRKQLSSFFSKLGRTNSGSGDIPQSSFYVDIPAEERGKGTEGKAVEMVQGQQGDGTATSRKEPAAAVAGPVMMSVLSSGGLDGVSLQSVLQAGGQVASQEELDNVIDLLSGGHKVAPSMQSIPENFPSTTQAHMQKAIGSHLNNHGNHHVYQQPLDSLEADYYGNQSHSLHRRSDGLIGETLGSRESKTNTWPYRPGTKSSSLSSDASSQFSNAFTYDSFPNDAEYSRYLAAVKQMKHGGNHYGQQVLPPQSPWATGDPGAGVHKGWNMFAGEVTDPNSRGWSAVMTADSSSCSDESSNGEAPWMMGIDLVGAMNDKRRHSSGEESFPSGPNSSTPESRPKSVEDLLDAKSTNTWPPKQPWAKSSQHVGENVSKENLPFSILHPPLTAQWSDPLASRPQGLSAWSAGIPSALSQQSLPSYAHMSPGGTTESPHTPGSHSKLERKYSVLT